MMYMNILDPTTRLGIIRDVVGWPPVGMTSLLVEITAQEARDLMSFMPNDWPPSEYNSNELSSALDEAKGMVERGAADHITIVMRVVRQHTED
jgi:hypothetical protein